TLDDYIPRIEKEISAKLKEPVRIGSLRAGGLPLPHVTVSGITIGKTDDITVGKVTVSPDLMSLLRPTKVIRSIEIDQLVRTQKGMDKITKPDGGGKPGKSAPLAPAQPPAVRVQSIKLDDAILKLQQAAFGPFDAKLDLNDEGSLASAFIAAKDGK